MAISPSSMAQQASIGAGSAGACRSSTSDSDSWQLEVVQVEPTAPITGHRTIVASSAEPSDEATECRRNRLMGPDPSLPTISARIVPLRFDEAPWEIMSVDVGSGHRFLAERDAVGIIPHSLCPCRACYYA
jgi:hypothetical protein